MISLGALDLFIRFTLLRRCIAVFLFQQHLSVGELNWITEDFISFASKVNTCVSSVCLCVCRCICVTEGE